MIKVSTVNNPLSDSVVTTVIVPRDDLVEIRASGYLSQLDRYVIDSPEESPADTLQTLAILVRTQEQAKEDHGQSNNL